MTANGAVLIGSGPVLSEAQQACADLLDETVELAREGKINAVAIVVCMGNGIGTVMAGKDASSLNLGCDDLKAKIHRAIFEDGNVAAPKSRILRAK